MGNKRFVMIDSYTYESQCNYTKKILRIEKRIINLDLIDLIGRSSYRVKEEEYGTIAEKEFTVVHLKDGYKDVLTDLTVEEMYELLEGDNKKESIL